MATRDIAKIQNKEINTFHSILDFAESMGFIALERDSPLIAIKSALTYVNRRTPSLLVYGTTTAINTVTCATPSNLSDLIHLPIFHLYRELTDVVMHLHYDHANPLTFQRALHAFHEEYQSTPESERPQLIHAVRDRIFMQNRVVSYNVQFNTHEMCTKIMESPYINFQQGENFHYISLFPCETEPLSLIHN